MSTPARTFSGDAVAVLNSRPAADLERGESAAIARTLREADIDLFAALSGDFNPAHLDAAYAEASPFRGVIAHGLWGGALISAVIGMHLPGPGAIYLAQDFRFRRPVRPGDAVEARVTVADIDLEKNAVRLTCAVTADGALAIEGEAKVLAPREARRWEVEDGFEAVVIERPMRFSSLIAETAGPPLAVRPAGRAITADDLARAERAGLVRLDPEASISISDQVDTPGAAGLVLVDAPAAVGLIAIGWGALDGWSQAARAAGFDPADAAPLTPGVLRDRPARCGLFHAASAELALTCAEALDQLGGAAAFALHDPAGPCPVITADDPDGFELAAGLAIAARLSPPAPA